MRAAFVGLGRMGAPMARNALDAGHDVTVFDVRAEPVDVLVAHGARPAASLAEAADGAEVIDVVVLDAEQVQGVAFGADGLLAHAQRGAVLAVHSTVQPSTVRNIAAAAPDDVDVLDAPISGGVGGAVAGTLCVMVGGEPAAFERARPVFESVGSLVVHLGPLGAGLGAKLARNLVGYVSLLGTREGVRLARAANVDLDVLRRILEHTGAVSPMMSATLDWTDDVTFDVPEMVSMAEKDLRAALELADDLGIDLPGTALTLGNAADAIGGPLGSTP
jgi:3-hydroxyisobutyrate dehydrogenase-like beta-hydroxyacid dehydrogenase